MTETGKVVDGDIKRTGAIPQLRQDRNLPDKNKPRPVGRQPK